MALIIRDGTNTARTITGLVIRDGANTPRTISQLWVRDTTNTPRLVYSTASTLAASASPEDVFGYDNGTGTATASPSTVTPTGGSGPYTYLWSLVSYTSGVAPVISSPSTATTAFYQTGMAPSDFFVAVFRCTVTDALLNTASADVNASFYSLGP